MNDLEKQIADALAQLGARHGVASRQPEPESIYTRDMAAVDNARLKLERMRARPVVSADVDMRDSLARLQSKPARTAVNKNERDLEGRYATVHFPDGVTAVYVDTVERRSTGVKAYVLRLDNRTRCYVLTELLVDVRDVQ